ncbi:MAG: hypothetical protein B6244_10580 [Candidatus Cloacimonetes bacterium 4572_55]|nr:MAG: hypothetical protein B6244_10580 [Candidatus Cloacimonetes bacterium 4572_55]
MSILEAIFLGLVQGLTEFLPISSSGHLVIFGHLIESGKPSLLFDVFVHLGTLIAILIYYRDEVIRLIISMRSLPAYFRREKISEQNTDSLRFQSYLVIGMIPVVLIALLLGYFIERFFYYPLFACVMLVVTGFILMLSKLAPVEKNRLNLKIITMIGVAQALALFPGISRSGTTIAVALILGVDKERAAKFSFFLAIPAIIGAVVMTLFKTSVLEMAQADWLPILFGTVVASASGYAAIELLLRALRKGELYYFSYYCWGVGILGFIKFWNG